MGQRVDRRAHRLEIVADHEQRPTRSDRVQQVANTAAIGSAGNRCVLRRHEVERSGFVRIERVCDRVVALDAYTAALGLEVGLTGTVDLDDEFTTVLAWPGPAHQGTVMSRASCC